jgi:predicted dehydrogenase
MTKTYRVGVIGFAHMHVNHLIDQFDLLPNVQWVACADTVPNVKPLAAKATSRQANVKRAHEKTGILKVYEDYREMLDKENFDIIIFCPENARHGEVGEAIAEKGIHMLTEKPMSVSLGDALRLARAVKRNGVELMVNFPTTWRPAYRKMKSMIDEGVIGEVWEVKWRNGASLGPLSYTTGDDIFTDAEKGSEWWHHETTGGGALLDYCSYGACLSRHFIGEQAVSAVALKANIHSQYGDANDNAVMVVRFPKAMAVLEASWTTWNPGNPHGAVVYGTKGTLVIDSPVLKVYTSRSFDSCEPDMVTEGEPLPEGRATEAEELIHHLETGEPLHPTLEIERNLEAMAILDAGMRSANSGKMEVVDNAVWCIG